MSRDRVSVALRWVVCAAIALGAAACGESGGNPVLYPEVRFQVQPVGGQGTFKVDQLVAGGVQYTSLAPLEFTVTGIFNFVIEQAPPPYEGTFTQIGNTEIRVRLVFNPANGTPFETIKTTSDEQKSISVSSGQQPSTLSAPSPEVRFDVCTPAAGETTCGTFENPPDQYLPGRFGLQFGGTLGDFFTTHLIGQSTPSDPPSATPSIYFLQNPQDQVSGVFRSVDGSLLIGRLFVNGVVKQVGTGTNQDVVLKSDIPL